MNYKKICHIHLYLDAVALGIIVDHDSYHMFLAIASALTAYFLARLLFSSKVARFFFFVPTSIAICQLSVTAKRAIMEEGFKATLQKNPTGVLFSDILYGFRHVVMTVGEAFGGFAEVIGLDKYSTFESLNYRFFTIAVMIIIMTFIILREKSQRVSAVSA